MNLWGRKWSPHPIPLTILAPPSLHFNMYIIVLFLPPQKSFLSFSSSTLKVVVVVHSLSHSDPMEPTLCNPKDCSSSGFLVLHCLLEFAQTPVH